MIFHKKCKKSKLALLSWHGNVNQATIKQVAHICQILPSALRRPACPAFNERSLQVHVAYLDTSQRVLTTTSTSAVRHWTAFRIQHLSSAATTRTKNKKHILVLSIATGIIGNKIKKQKAHFGVEYCNRYWIDDV